MRKQFIEVNGELAILVNGGEVAKDNMNYICSRLNEETNKAVFYVDMVWQDYGLRKMHNTIICKPNEKSKYNSTFQLLSPRDIEIICEGNLNNEHDLILFIDELIKKAYL